MKKVLEYGNQLLKNISNKLSDNAAVMTGEDKGLQTLFKNSNKQAEYVPCQLNLVREKATVTVNEIFDYLSILQQLCFPSRLIS